MFGTVLLGVILLAACSQPMPGPKANDDGKFLYREKFEQTKLRKESCFLS